MEFLSLPSYPVTVTILVAFVTEHNSLPMDRIFMVTNIVLSTSSNAGYYTE